MKINWKRDYIRNTYLLGISFILLGILADDNIALAVGIFVGALNILFATIGIFQKNS